MRKLQLISGIVILAFAALICFGSSKLTFGTPGRPGPGFFPLGLGTILFLLSLIFVLKTALTGRRISDSARALWTGLRWKQVPYTLAPLLRLRPSPGSVGIPYLHMGSNGLPLLGKRSEEKGDCHDWSDDGIRYQLYDF